MRAKFHDLAEKGRCRAGRFATEPGERRGVFVLRHPAGAWLQVIADDGADWGRENLPGGPWEHVSVSTSHPDTPPPLRRTPTWEEMAWVKSLFWGEDECVVEYHPPKARYVNVHPGVLHLWRPTAAAIPMPPAECV